jgi:hypothetical protein
MYVQEKMVIEEEVLLTRSQCPYRVWRKTPATVE